ncbi:MAG TPA: AtpZ/AtpI family protein [Patescibacteria group bacterium]|nr:AtpZ/AtpI family protein [Patescibacteria group bacterium]
MPEPEQKPKLPPVNKWLLVNFAFEFGFIIAIPLLILALGGKWLDAKQGTYPAFTLAGVVLAIAASTLWISKRVKRYIR